MKKHKAIIVSIIITVLFDIYIAPTLFDGGETLSDGSDFIPVIVYPPTNSGGNYTLYISSQYFANANYDKKGGIYWLETYTLSGIDFSTIEIDSSTYTMSTGGWPDFPYVVQMKTTLEKATINGETYSVVFASSTPFEEFLSKLFALNIAFFVIIYAVLRRIDSP